MRISIEINPAGSLKFKNNVIEQKNEFEDKYISSFNTATLEDIRDILYELHEYFDEFEIEVVACPSLTREPYNFESNGLSKNTYILEIHDSTHSFDLEMDPDPQTGAVNIPIRPGRNYFFSNMRPGMVLKMRAKGRKTNYNIITLMQNILHKRFCYKIGLGGAIVIKGGQLVEGYFENNSSELMCHDINCNFKIEIPMGAIVNDPVTIIGQHDGLFYTSDRYMFCFNSQFGLNWFVNDVTPEETEYVGYFNIAEEVTHF